MLCLPDFEDKYNSRTAKSANKDNTMVSISQIELNELRSTIRSLEGEVKLLNGVLDDMRTEFKTNSDKLLAELEKEPTRNGVGSVRCADDELYFHTYAHYDIHHEMLSVRILN